MRCYILIMIIIINTNVNYKSVRLSILVQSCFTIFYRISLLKRLDNSNNFKNLTLIIGRQKHIKPWKQWLVVLTDKIQNPSLFHKDFIIRLKENVKNFKRQDLFITLKIIVIFVLIVKKRKEYYKKEIRDISKYQS